jgi:hypothetical protein
MRVFPQHQALLLNLFAKDQLQVTLKRPLRASEEADKRPRMLRASQPQSLLQDHQRPNARVREHQAKWGMFPLRLTHRPL